jgi:hypothetical protein
MGDMADSFNALKEHDKERRKKNLNAAIDDGWKKHTPYHWSRKLNGKRLDYWPSRNKFKYNDNVMCGDVAGFIRNREAH